ncbi:hypothetical protein HOD30_03410 [Candidatus Peregrinibacteria bacterium]|jgi:hypothetical protein|nr:hypothetical protein [Candidatus Peregrinibacteria bacterium]MBT4631644.1 hypothetical protein [Candidatus Peregrinibacteria bacterium]MBT5823946.1 hypothetical protein [Candidatus Peregrinibacteria bacterium]
MSKRRNIFQKVLDNPLMFLGFLLMAGLLAFQMHQLYEMRHRLTFIDSIESSNSQVISEVSQAKDYLTGFGNDLNQIRSFLLLPTQEYDFSELGDLVPAQSQNLTSLVFQYVDRLGEYENNKTLFSTNEAALKTYVTDKDWTNSGLHLLSPEGVYSEDSLSYTFYGAEPLSEDLLKVSLNYDGDFTFDTFMPFDGFETTSDAEVTLTALDLFLTDDLARQSSAADFFRAQVELFRNEVLNDEFLGFLDEHGLLLSDFIETPIDGRFNVQNYDGRLIGSLLIYKEDGRITLEVEGEETEFAASPAGLNALITHVLTLDLRTNLQILVDDRRKEFEDLMGDRAFNKTLEQVGFTIGDLIETGDRLSYPILNGEGETLRMLYIDKATGEVNVDWPGEGSESLVSAIQSLEIGFKKKTLRSRIIFLA